MKTSTFFLTSMALTSIGIFCHFNANSQITVNQGDFMIIGGVYVNGNDTNPAITVSPGSKGANQT
ncbi:MAG TPA: hypothetical protein VK808_04585, partial [Bacteroidia bacterium]|nr:hypothetical protein [Bacteroidia bacterium]